MTHRNTFAAMVATGISTLAIWLADRLFHYELSQVYGAVIAGAVVSAVLFVGRRGIKGTLLALWNGGQMAWRGPAAPKPAPRKPAK